MQGILISYTNVKIIVYYYTEKSNRISNTILQNSFMTKKVIQEISASVPI